MAPTTLRARPADIPLLASHFVREIAARLGRRPPALGPGVLQDLAAYGWPGNVRELRNVLERSLILDSGDVLGSLDLPPVQGLAPLPAAPDAELNLRGALMEHLEGDLFSTAALRGVDLPHSALTDRSANLVNSADHRPRRKARLP